jgi:hypothetical protein
VDHKRHEDAALQREARNALTMSGLHAYHKRPVTLVSHQATICRLSLGRIFINVEASKQVCKSEV